MAQKSKRCPSCRSEVPVESCNCPNCPYSFPQEPEAGAPGHSVAGSWSPLPLAAVLLVVGSVLGMWMVFFTEAEKGRVARGDDISALLRGQVPAPAGPPPAFTPQAPAAQMSPKLREAVDRAQDEEDGSGGVAITAEGKAPAPVKEWRLRGHLYDLLSFRPLPSCRLVFTDVNTNAIFETVTDPGGRYRAILPPLPGRGYLLKVSLSGYAPAYLDPGTEGVREKPEEERRVLCRDLGTAVMQPASLQPHDGDPLVTDFYLVPLSCR